jgi:eukaryotic-like serine/threonine-protein kinase
LRPYNTAGPNEIGVLSPARERWIMGHASEPSRASQTVAGGPAGETIDLSGRTLGDFQLLRRLGQGGMGQVYLAEQISLKRRVAIKILRADLAANPASLQRFKQEATAVARATHANIVQIYVIDEADGLHFMALEYVEGRNLRQFLEKKGPPEVLLALSIIRQVASALQRASELGIIHRDIKPENILLTRKGEVKVADFGLSRCFAGDPQPLNLTQSGVTMGTPLYMAPEQVEGKTVDPRTDIYSFGVTCYHLLAGQPPFRGQTAFEVALQHVQTEPVPLSEVRPDLPRELCALVHKMMVKKPEGRFQTGREIVREAGRLRDTLVGVTGAQPQLVTLGPAAPLPTDAASTQSIPIRRSRRWLAWAVPLSLLLALGGGLLYGWRRNAAESAPPPPEAVEPAAELTRAQLAEKRLLERVKDNTNPKDQLERSSGLGDRIQLGLLYLKQRRLDEAETFFEGLKQAKDVKPYYALGLLGEAMVLAFRDRAKESEQAFLKAIGKERAFERLSKGGLGGRMSLGPLYEMTAEALNHNLSNLGVNRLQGPLERYRHPPALPGRAPRKGGPKG